MRSSPPPRQSSCVLGFAATPRYLGCAVVIGGFIVLLPMARIRSQEDPAPDIERAGARLVGIMRKYRPRFAAIEASMIRAEPGSVVDLMRCAVEQAAARQGIAVVPVTRGEIGTALRLADPSVAAVRTGLIARHRYLTFRIGTMGDARSHRPRTERERHWDPAFLAASAAFTLIEQANNPL